MKSQRTKHRTPQAFLAEPLESRTLFTALTFDVPLNNTAPLPPGYGSHVSATHVGSFSYGSNYGLTPNVSVSYGDTASNIRTYDKGFGDLTNVIYGQDGYIDVTLTADPGHYVGLHSFDLGGFFHHNQLINSVEVVSGRDILYHSKYGVTVSGASHTSFNFGTPLFAQSMTIRVDATNLAAKTYVGMDNVVFDQQPNWTAFQGQVINDKNANGIQDGGEAGLAGIEMFLDTNNNGVLDPDEVHTLTDFAGQYNFGMVTPGQYHVREVLPAGTRLSKTAGNGFAILGQPGIYNFVRFYDTQKAEIQVNFFEDRNDDGIRQANEIPPLYAAPPETLQLYKQFQRGVIATAQCDTAGNLTFDNLAPGTYVLKDVSPDYLTTARTVTVTVGSGGIGTALFGEGVTM